MALVSFSCHLNQLHPQWIFFCANYGEPVAFLHTLVGALAQIHGVRVMQR